jgi:hypothetical protein
LRRRGWRINEWIREKPELRVEGGKEGGEEEEAVYKWGLN